jgi:hypothetical protein
MHIAPTSTLSLPTTTLPDELYPSSLLMLRFICDKPRGYCFGFIVPDGPHALAIAFALADACTAAGDPAVVLGVIETDRHGVTSVHHLRVVACTPGRLQRSLLAICAGIHRAAVAGIYPDAEACILIPSLAVLAWSDETAPADPEPFPYAEIDGRCRWQPIARDGSPLRVRPVQVRDPQTAGMLISPAHFLTCALRNEQKYAKERRIAERMLTAEEAKQTNRPWTPPEPGPSLLAIVAELHLPIVERLDKNGSVVVVRSPVTGAATLVIEDTAWFCDLVTGTCAAGPRAVKALREHLATAPATTPAASIP